MEIRRPFLIDKYAVLVFVLVVATPAFRLTGQSWAQKCSPTLQISARSEAMETYRLVVKDCEAFSGKVLQEGWPLTILSRYEMGNILVVRTSRNTLLDDLLPLSDLLYADRGFAEIKEELPVPGHDIFVNKINALHAKYPDWNGTGRTVSVMEKRFDTTDIDLHGRIAPVLTGADAVTIHASIMASLIGGAGISDAAGLGVAPGCRLASSDFALLLPDDDGDYAAQDISVQNHSYGVGIENYYGADAMAFDQSVRVRPSLVHVFSAGNLGGDSPATGAYQGVAGFANLTGGFKMAKNILVVGAVDSFGRVVPYSSRGPAYDGRIKPDLVAFGPDGTSGAAALVSGTAAVLQQAFAEKHNGALPPAALIRAVLLNSAEDTGFPGPDFVSGFGNLNAVQAAKAIEKKHYFIGELDQNEEVTVEVIVPPYQHDLTLTLAWDDPAAPAGASKALVNDLDVSLAGPVGQTLWLPWKLNASPHPDSLLLPAVRGIDSLNNAEQISISFPEAGKYQIRIRGRHIASAKQVFALVFDWNSENSFSWTFPLRQSVAVAGKAAVVQWETNIDDPAGRLEYSLNEGGWITIDSTVSLKDGEHRWFAPDTFATARLRMVTTGQPFYTDTFLLAPAQQIKVGFTCPDSVLLYWKKAGTTGLYTLWGLGGQYLEPLFSTPDTFAVLPRDDFPQTYFAVSPRHVTGLEGLRSGAPNITTQGVGCYFRSFIAELNDTGQTNLSLLLGTTYGLEKVSLEKLHFGSDVIGLQSWGSPVTDIQFLTIDPTPVSGVNFYRARLDLSNGGVLYSDTATVYFAGNEAFLAFPNPISTSGSLYIISQVSSDGSAVLTVFDPLGRLMVQRTLDEVIAEIPIAAWPPGVYTYAVRQAGRVVFSGKIVVQP